MPRLRTLPDNETIIRHIEDDWTYQRIANEYGTTREAVSLLVARYKLAPTFTGPLLSAAYRRRKAKGTASGTRRLLIQSVSVHIHLGNLDDDSDRGEGQ